MGGHASRSARRRRAAARAGTSFAVRDRPRRLAERRSHSPRGIGFVEAAGRGAPAYTFGRDIFFAPGLWSPETLVGQALLAHELAHVVQQSLPDTGAAGVDLELSASRAAAAAVRRLHGSPEAAPATGPGAGLRLLRCAQTAKALNDADRQFQAPYLDEASQAPSPSVPDLPDPAALVSAAETGWSRIPDDHILAVQSQDQLFLLPAHYFVSEGEGPLAASATKDPGRRPVVGATAVGHGSLQLLNVGGTGILLDAGGATQAQPDPSGRRVATRAILPRSLAALQRSLGIASIDAVLLVHTHADHVRFLVELIQSGNIRGNRVWIWPGWERATRGPWADVMRALRDPALQPRGFGPSWSPTPLPIQTIGATGTELTVATLRVGNAELAMVTRSDDLRAYVAEKALFPDSGITATESGVDREFARDSMTGLFVRRLVPKGAIPSDPPPEHARQDRHHRDSRRLGPRACLCAGVGAGQRTGQACRARRSAWRERACRVADRRSLRRLMAL